jgi:hypothetical protein
MNSSEQKIKAILVIEVLGRPPEHLVATLEGIAKEMGEEKGVKVVDKKINPPVLMKDQKDFWTSFAEIDVEIDEILYLAMLMFKYMPANIEILSPQNISLPNAGWNEILNELTRRLHGYEEIARILQTEKMIMEKKLRELMPNSVQIQDLPAENSKPKKSLKGKKKK